MIQNVTHHHQNLIKLHVSHSKQINASPLNVG